MTTYMIIRENSKEDLEQMVCCYIEDGYSPCGGVAVYSEPDMDDVIFFQAIALNTCKPLEN